MDVKDVINIYRWAEDFVKEMLPYFTHKECNIAYTHIDATIWEFVRRLHFSQSDLASLVLEREATFAEIRKYIFD